MSQKAFVQNALDIFSNGGKVSKEERQLDKGDVFGQKTIVIKDSVVLPTMPLLVVTQELG